MLGIRELYASLTITALVSTATVFWLYFSRFSTRGVLWWVISMSCYLLCLILMTLRGIIPPFFSEFIANIAATAGYVCFWFAIRLFFNRPLTRNIWGCGLFLTLLITVASGIALYDSELVTGKVLIIGINYSTINIFTAYELLRNAHRSNAAKVLAAINIINAVIINLRGFHIVQTASFNTYFTTGWTTSAYVLWTNLSLLITTLGLMMLIVEDLHSKLARQAMEDPLTGLFNRRALTSITPEEFSELKNNKMPLGLLMLDIDHFKAVNDTYGHTTGDALLKQFADEVSSCLRSTDTLYRIGGEEFLIIAPNASITNLQALGERIRNHIEQTPLVITEGTIYHTVSIGCAISYKKDMCLNAILERADTALYSAKALGRNKVIIPEVAV
ncbi:GGDEF domain-containing protein [Halodesulfovibrio marinisediminis]|uniref:diguanylate cyclase n=1 Tax=Halodesulfovibrio marinisediminis DSM 17456 TaxID=1121457 RepID=A0A1N6IJ94_9BACT|nr:GGDEF domain-containing protein [Halodesulfovibrio marinisediminis]SIO32059.1 diguanylate cyclase (GGDEF) domain-containing protein [Halodesulfovibrio marinisediminis DSM 17456]